MFPIPDAAAPKEDSISIPIAENENAAKKKAVEEATTKKRQLEELRQQLRSLRIKKEAEALQEEGENQAHTNQFWNSMICFFDFF